MGLGLAICKEIMEAHRGEVRVRDNEGGGSVFSIHLPMASRLVDRQQVEAEHGGGNDCIGLRNGFQSTQ